MKDLINTLNKVGHLLNRNGYKEEAKEMYYFSEKITAVERKSDLEDIKEGIIQRCHIKWLGDFYIEEFKGGYGWHNLLNELRDLASEL